MTGKAITTVINFPAHRRIWAQCRHCGGKQKRWKLSGRGWCSDCEEDSPERRRQLDEEFIASLRADGASEEFISRQIRVLVLTSGFPPPKTHRLPHALRAQYLRLRLARPDLFTPR